MKAETLNCPNCGAAISSDSPRCQFCESKLATVACPTCFAMMFIGSRNCPHCGTAAVDTRATSLSNLKCPKCKSDMLAITLGGSAMRECETCSGLWLEVATFEKICADREHQAAVLGMPSPVVEHQIHPAGKIQVRYFPCPHCLQLMNRMNFARCSGVIVDVCRGHGIWFDRDELHSIIEFIRAGGLELARNREKRQIAFEREQLRSDQSLDSPGMRDNYSDAELLDGFSASRGMLKFLSE